MSLALLAGKMGTCEVRFLNCGRSVRVSAILAAMGRPPMRMPTNGLAGGGAVSEALLVNAFELPASEAPLDLALPDLACSSRVARLLDVFAPAVVGTGGVLGVDDFDGADVGFAVFCSALLALISATFSLATFSASMSMAICLADFSPDLRPR